MADIFVSYASEDRDRIQPLVEVFQAEGWSVWWDRDLVAGRSFEETIEEALEAAHCVVIAWSEHSATSRWCRAEANDGLERQVLVPLRIDDIRPPLAFRASQTASLLGWPDERGELDALLAGVRECLADQFATATDTAEARGRASVSTVVPRAVPPRGTTPARWWRNVTALVAVGALLVAGGWALFNAFKSDVDPIDRIAVLPLNNFMNDPEQDFFVEGMHEALITNLARIGALHVISRTSVMGFKDTGKSSPQIGDELNVQALVQGSVFRAGDSVRIAVQLIEASTDRHLWAESYERELRDVLALQKEVALAIAQEIRIRVTPAEEERLASVRPVDPDAYEAYLKGNFHYEIVARGGGTLESLRRSLEYHQEAIRRDPGWALAHAGLAKAYHWLGSMGSGAEFYPKSKAAALKALELDDGLARAHASLGFVLHRYDWDWEGAQREFRRAMELDPNSHQWGFALFLSSAGRYEEAIASFRREEEQNPSSLLVKLQLGTTYTCAGQYDEAVKQLQKVIELDAEFIGAYVWLAETYLRKSMYEEAVAELEKAAELFGDAVWTLPRIGYAYARAGRTTEAQEILRELEATEQGFFPELYVALGQKDKALTQYEAAFEKRDDGLLLLRCRLEYDSLRDEPRFQDLLRQMNFPQ